MTPSTSLQKLFAEFGFEAVSSLILAADKTKGVGLDLRPGIDRAFDPLRDSF